MATKNINAFMHLTDASFQKVIWIASNAQFVSACIYWESNHWALMQGKRTCWLFDYFNSGSWRATIKKIQKLKMKKKKYIKLTKILNINKCYNSVYLNDTKTTRRCRCWFWQLCAFIKYQFLKNYTNVVL